MFKKKLVTSILSVVTAASILAPCNVFAADSNSYTDKGSASIPITSIDVGSYYTVTLPAAIAGFTQNAKTGDYETSFPITVKGSVIPTQELYVIPAYKDGTTIATAEAAEAGAASTITKFTANKFADSNPDHGNIYLSKIDTYITNTTTTKNVPITIRAARVAFCNPDRTTPAINEGSGETGISISGTTYDVSLKASKTDVTAGTYSGSVEMAWGLVDSGT